MNIELKFGAVELRLCVSDLGLGGTLGVLFLSTAWVLTTVYGFYPVMP